MAVISFGRLGNYWRFTTIVYFPRLSRVLADSWPMVFDDRGARQDWGWKHKYDLDALVKVMFQYLAPKFGIILPGLWPEL